jgi:hypothetical protein
VDCVCTPSRVFSLRNGEGGREGGREGMREGGVRGSVLCYNAVL